MAQVVTQLIVDASGAKTGVAEFTAQMDKAKKAATEAGDATATSFERAQAKWTASLAKTDPVIKAQIAMEKDLARQREIGANAVKLGIATQDAAAAQLAKVSQQHQTYIATLTGATKATTELATAHKGLDAQGQAALHSIRSIGEQMALGISPVQALTGQINHLTYAATGEGGLAGAFKQVGGFVGGLINPTTVAIGATVALGAAVAAAAVQYDRLQVSSQRAIGGAGQRTGTSVGDLNAFTSQNAAGFSGSNLSTKEARTLGEDLTKTGEIVISRLHGMSDAVVGFSNQTGHSMSEASKAMVGFAVDPKKALQELSGVYGNFDVATRKAVDALVLADDKTGAFNVILDALSEKSKKAAENMGLGEKATRSFINALSVEATKPRGLDAEVEAARGRLNAAIDQGNSSNPVDRGFAAQDVAKLSREFEVLYAAQQKVKDQQIAAEFNKLSTAADEADRAIIPQIAQIEQLSAKLEELNRAKAGGATSKYGADVDAAATQALQNQLAVLRESQAEAARYNQQVAQISAGWSNVGQSTALALQAMQNSLPVAQAWTEATRMRAQQQATYNNLIDKGRTSEEAAAVAAKEYQLSKAAAVASAEKLVQSSQDNVDLIRAQGTGMEGVVQSSIAYRDAIDAGATATQAAAIAANTLEANLMRAAQAAQQTEQSMLDAANGTRNGILTPESAMALGPGGSDFAPSVMPKGPLGFSGSTDAGVMKIISSLQQQASAEATGIAGLAGSAYATGGIAGALAAIRNAPSTFGADPSLNSFQSSGGHSSPIDFTAILGAQRATSDEKMSTYDQFVQLQNSQTSDKGLQATNLQGEIDYLQTLPVSISRDQKIIDLTNSIQQLKDSTDSLNATNSELLSPYYTQDPRTSHIGFRSQGMASGGEFTVPGGYSANDNMLGTIPLASGEIVSVRRPGESGGSGKTIHINITNNIGAGANVDQFKKTSFQNTQNMVHQIRNAS